MRQLGAVLVATLTLSGCIGGPDVDAADAILIRHDMQPEATVDMAPPDGMPDVVELDAADLDAAEPEPDMPPDMRPDREVDVGPDMPAPGPCAVPDAIVPGELPLIDRAWRREVLERASESQLSPDCGDLGHEMTAGRELKVRVVPEVHGRHLVIAAGRFSATYRSSVCNGDELPEISGCEVPEMPFDSPPEEPPIRVAWIDARAGEAFDLVADAPAGQRAGPVVIVVYPPVAEGGSCALINESAYRPACAPDTACIDAVCRYVGAPRADAVRAWSDGQSLRVEAEFSGQDLIGALWVRIGEEPFTQISLTEVADGMGGVVRGFLEDPALAASERIEVEMVDASDRKGRRAVEVARLVPRRAGAACDRNGLRDTCRPGDACIDGRCAEAEIGAWTTAAGLNLDVALPEAPDGVELIAVVRDEEAPPDARWVPLPDRPAEIGRRWTALGIQPPPAGFAMRIQTSRRPPGLPIAVEALPQPIREEGDACDLESIADRCVDGLACHAIGGGGRCVGIDPPEIRSLFAWAGDDALGIKATFFDPQDDVEQFRFRVLSAQGDVRFATDELQWVPDPQQGFFVVSFEAPWGPEVDDVLELELIDATDRASATARTRLRRPPEVDVGVACDPLEAWAICGDDDAICAALDAAENPRCEPFEPQCPEAWRPFPLAAPTRHDDNSAGGPNRTAGRCGGGDSPEAIYEVHALRDARWRISVVPPGAAVYVRTHCQFAVQDEAELGCSREPLEIEVEEDETYYVFVDGPGAGARFALIIDEAGPIDPSPVEPID